MKQVTLGKYQDGHVFKVDINRLISTRLVVQANSGGGKSWLIRKLVEELFGKVQIIILDIEGDFLTLREKFDFILAGKGGDITAEPRYAEQLARKTLELEANLIVDLYELKKPNRIQFVKRFLEAMVEAPRELWHPVVVILDEAHLFAPENTKSESLAGVVDMASRGRKRGFCLIAATQRAAKLDKDASAELQNKLIGLGNTDADRERGARELGFTHKDQILTMRDLEPGQFYAVGPAFGHRGAKLVQIGDVITTHPESGTGRLKVHTPAPTAKVKAQLAKLENLPKEAEEELKTVAELRTKVRQLEHDLRSKKPAIDEKQLDLFYQKGVKETERRLGTIAKEFREFVRSTQSKANSILEQAALAEKRVEKVPRDLVGPPMKIHSHTYQKPRLVERAKPVVQADGEQQFGICERKILGFLSVKPGEFFSKVQVGAMTGYSHGSGGFNNSLSKLSSAGLIVRSADSRIALNTDADVSHLIDGHDHKLQDWIGKLGQCERKVYEKLLEEPDRVWTVEEMGEATEYSAKSGGFNNSLSRLSTLGLLKREGRGQIRLNPEVLEVAS